MSDIAGNAAQKRLRTILFRQAAERRNAGYDIRIDTAAGRYEVHHYGKIVSAGGTQGSEGIGLEVDLLDSAVRASRRHEARPSASDVHRDELVARSNGLHQRGYSILYGTGSGQPSFSVFFDGQRVALGKTLTLAPNGTSMARYEAGIVAAEQHELTAEAEPQASAASFAR